MKQIHKSFWLFFLCFIFYSCKHPISNKAFDSTSDESVEDNFESKKIALILLHISNNDGQYSITISNSKIIETKKKYTDNKSDKWNENDFVCFVVDKNKTIIDTLLIFQPLHPRYEYPEDDNTIGSKIIEQKEKDVLLRFSYLNTMKYLRIEKGEKTLNYDC